jgi:MYXO-CTERM domain-containing protein
MITGAIAAVLGNLSVVLFLIALVVAAMKTRGSRSASSNVPDAFWREIVFYAIGLSFVYFATLHAFFGPWTSRLIGWRPSPYEWELAWAEYGIAAVAILSLWRGFEMRLAATLSFSIFSFGAAAQHIHEIVCCANDNPGNAGLTLWFGDIALPLIALALAAAARRRRVDG